MKHERDILDIAPVSTRDAEGNITVVWQLGVKFTTDNESIIIASTEPVVDVIAFDTLVANSNKTSDKAKLLVEFRVNLGDGKTSAWYVATPASIARETCKEEQYSLEFRLTRTGPSWAGTIQVGNITATGKYNIPKTTGLLNLQPGQTGILETLSIWKMFSLTGLEIVADGTGAKIDYQISQTNGRVWSDWKPLTEANFRAQRVDPLRFFQIRYRVTAGTTPYMLQDVILYGDFTNVTQNYAKSPKLGIRLDCKREENPDNCCDNPYTELNKQFTPPSCAPGSQNNANSCGPKWQPYSVNKAIQLYEFLAKSANSIVSHEVDFYKTDPDKNGRDVLLHEYQLYNINQKCKLRVIVPNNAFPDTNTAQFTMMDSVFFDQFTIHILRDEFKQVFGVDKRPEEYDILFFCQRNQLYEIQHAYAHRDFMNASIYYVVNLRKYQDNKHIQASTPEIGNDLAALTDIAGYASLVGDEFKEELDKIANKDQHRPLSKDPYERILAGVGIAKEELEHGPNIVATNHYTFIGTKPGQQAVGYGATDGELALGENRAWISWFKWDSMKKATSYNLINNWLEGKGYRIDIKDKEVIFLINDKTYKQKLNLSNGIWYNIIINLDQSNKKVQLFVYKRRSETEPFIGSSVEFVSVDAEEIKLKSNYEFSLANSLEILGCGDKFYMTNIRIFNSLIPPSEHVAILNQLNVRDSQHLLLADNAEPKMRTFRLRDQDW